MKKDYGASAEKLTEDSLRLLCRAERRLMKAQQRLHAAYMGLSQAHRRRGNCISSALSQRRSAKRGPTPSRGAPNG